MEWPLIHSATHFGLSLEAHTHTCLHVISASRPRGSHDVPSARRCTVSTLCTQSSFSSFSLFTCVIAMLERENCCADGGAERWRCGCRRSPFRRHERRWACMASSSRCYCAKDDHPFLPQSSCLHQQQQRQHLITTGSLALTGLIIQPLDLALTTRHQRGIALMPRRRESCPPFDLVT